MQDFRTINRRDPIFLGFPLFSGEASRWFPVFSCGQQPSKSAGLGVAWFIGKASRKQRAVLGVTGSDGKKQPIVVVVG